MNPLTKTRDRVCDVIRKSLTERILNGTYPPDTRLTELSIAEEFGTSQAPVREALRELEAAGFVVSEPYRGTRVRTVSPKETRDAYLIRGILEQAAAETATAILQRDTSQLREAYQEMVIAASNRQSAVQAQCNQRFHRAIVTASGSQILLRLWESLSFETRTRARLDRHDSIPLKDAHTHLPIIEAFEQGNAELAGRLLKEHAHSFAPPATETEGQV